MPDAREDKIERLINELAYKAWRGEKEKRRREHEELEKQLETTGDFCFYCQYPPLDWEEHKCYHEEHGYSPVGVTNES